MNRRRKLILILAAIPVTAILAAWISHAQLRATNDDYLARLAAEGEPLTLDQILPPPVPVADNRADTFLQAAALLAADTSPLKTNLLNSMLPVGPGKAIPCSQLAQAPCYETTNTWADLDQALAQNQPALTLLQQLADHPDLDFHIHYERGMGDDFDFSSLNVVGLKRAAQFLSAASLIALHDQNVAAAVQDQQATLALVSALQYQRFVISDLVAMAILHIAQGPAWEILQTPGLTEPRLAALQHAWEHVDFLQSWQNSLAMERVTGEITLAQWRDSSGGLSHYLDLGKNARISMGLKDDTDTWSAKLRTQTKIFQWRYWWSYPDELRYLQGYQTILAAARSAAAHENIHAAITNQQAALAALQIPDQSNDAFFFSPESDFHYLLSQTVDDLSNVPTRVMNAEAARQITITAIALQRCKLATGRYPDRLADLVPTFLATVPPDPVDGQPLRYRPQPDGTYLLYSIGENAVDDGGNPALDGQVSTNGTPTTTSYYWQNHHALDWVWPQPASAAGIDLVYPAAK